jgi:uncharacterized surface protein with fasciclin (FAS1) repeats
MTIRTALLVAATASLAACGSGPDNSTAGDAAAATSAGPTAAKGVLADALAKPGSARFAAAARTAGMEPVFKGPGPYTLFMPSDAALAGAGDLAANKDALTKLISAHVLPGTILAEDIGHAIDANNGKAQLKTMAGGTLTATRDGDRIRLAGPDGGTATVTAANEVYSNGVVHHVDGVLKPRGR